MVGKTYFLRLDLCGEPGCTILRKTPKKLFPHNLQRMKIKVVGGILFPKYNSHYHLHLLAVTTAKDLQNQAS